MKVSKEKMQELAELTGLDFDGGEDDSRLFANDEFRINVFASLMKKAEYNKMENEINRFEIKGKGFHCYVWNDCSGYNYWSQDEDDANYIQVTVAIDDENANINAIKNAVQDAYDQFSRFDNTDEFFISKNKGAV